MLDSSILDAAKFQLSISGREISLPGESFFGYAYINIKKMKANTIFSFFRFVRFIIILAEINLRQ